MKWEEHLKEQRDIGFRDGENFANQTNLAATFISSVIVALVYNVNWKKLYKKTSKKARRLLR